jgi:hypothetical protein
MKVSELIGRLTEHIKINPNVADHELRIILQPTKGHFGGTTSAGIESLSMGFDWDSRKYFIHPDLKLQEKPAEAPPKKKTKDGYCSFCEKPYKPIVDGTATTGDICKCAWNLRREPEE